jgi:hypothetical protein
MGRPRLSKAAGRLREAPESFCAQCRRVTKTTTDRVCAECWTSKGGRRMRWKRDRPRGSSFLDDVVDFLLPFRW